MSAATPDREANRFTPSDVAAIRERLTETYKTVSSFTWPRIAANAVGCSLDDLRQSEIDAIGELITEICI